MRSISSPPAQIRALASAPSPLAKDVNGLALYLMFTSRSLVEAAQRSDGAGLRELAVLLSEVASELRVASKKADALSGTAVEAAAE